MRAGGEGLPRALLVLHNVLQVQIREHQFFVQLLLPLPALNALQCMKGK